MINLIKTLSWLHSFFLSRVSHKGEFYLERFLMRQHCTSTHFDYHVLIICNVMTCFAVIYLNYLSLIGTDIFCGGGRKSSTPSVPF